jgi:hypothetical protein
METSRPMDSSGPSSSFLDYSEAMKVVQEILRRYEILSRGFNFLRRIYVRDGMKGFRVF